MDVRCIANNVIGRLKPSITCSYVTATLCNRRDRPKLTSSED